MLREEEEQPGLWKWLGESLLVVVGTKGVRN